MLLRAWKHPVNRFALTSAVRRVFAYLVTCRLVGAPVPVPFANDTWLFCNRAGEEEAGLRLLVLRDFAEMSFVAHFLRPGEHFVDVGAGIGSYTVLAATVAQARVTAFEPAEPAASLLVRNVEFNRLGPAVRCLRVGLGDTPGHGRLGAGDAYGRIVLDPCAEPEASVAVKRLDDVLDGDSAHALKIDVSGDELAVLRGAHLTLQHPSLHAVVVSTEKGRAAHTTSSRWHLISALLEKYGFTPADYDPVERCLLKPTFSGEKCLFVRAWCADTIRRRIMCAPEFWPTADMSV